MNDRNVLNDELMKNGWQRSTKSSLTLSIYEKNGFEVKVDFLKIDACKQQLNYAGGYDQSTSNSWYNRLSIDKTGTAGNQIKLIESFRINRGYYYPRFS